MNWREFILSKEIYWSADLATREGRLPDLIFVRFFFFNVQSRDFTILATNFLKNLTMPHGRKQVGLQAASSWGPQAHNLATEGHAFIGSLSQAKHWLLEGAHS